MQRTLRRSVPLLACLVVLAGGERASAARVAVGTPQQLAAAILKLERSGGTIVLRPGRYPRIYLGPRAARRLTLLAHGASSRFVRLAGSRDVRIVGLAVRSTGPPGSRLDVLRSKRIVLDRVSLRGSAGSAVAMSLAGSTDVLIRGSRFSRCRRGGACIHLGLSSRVRILESAFADCRDCDFVRGGVVRGLAIRDSRFGNALLERCRADPRPACNHQDLVQLVAGTGVVIERNHFGINEYGAAQLYLSGPLRDVVVRNNVFRGVDPARPGYVAPVGITVGNRVEPVHPPLGVVLAHNTVLSGALHPRGSSSSIALSPLYAGLPVEDRPVVVNNVLALVGTPEWVCGVGTTIRNIVLVGATCSETDLRADAAFDPVSGAPGTGSPTVDAGEPGWALDDVARAPRDARPDVGAYEYRGG